MPDMMTQVPKNDKEPIGDNHNLTKDPPLISPTVTTAIVGAGVVGLCTAYHLAKANHRRDAAQSHKVLVVEAASKPFAATSSTNTGILTNTIPNGENLLPLTQYSYRLWEALGAEAEFRNESGYREDVNYLLKPGSGIGRDLLPEWLCSDAEWDAIKEPDHGRLAIVNPVALGHWLYKECLRYGVEFRFGTQVVRVNLSKSNQLVSLDLFTSDSNGSSDSSSGENQTTTVQIDNFILAAGPWTPTLFRTLFPTSSIDMEPVIIDAGDWIVFENPQPITTSANKSTTIAAIYLDDIVGEKLEFAGRNDGTIWATGGRSRSGEIPPVGRIIEPDEDRLDKLLANSRAFLKNGHGDNCGLKVLEQGRSYRPTTQNGRPVIGRVPAGRLSSSNGSIQSLDSARKSVYVNYGQGSYGLLLGMGSGKLMSQMLQGEKTDIDLSSMGCLS